MQRTVIKFGTDGWRGVIADDFTFENVRRVAQATADYWNSQNLPKAAIVGYDNRFLSEVYAKLVCEVFAANGIKAIYPPQAVPTPAVSFAVRDRKLCGAIMITASHNPPQFNGYKLKADFAGPADPELCSAIELRVDQSPLRYARFDEAVKAGSIEIYDPRPAHIAAIKKTIDLKKIRGSKLKVVVDSMYGCGGDLLQTVLAGGKVRVQTIRDKRDPLFGGINPEPIGKNLGCLRWAAASWLSRSPSHADARPGPPVSRWSPATGPSCSPSGSWAGAEARRGARRGVGRGVSSRSSLERRMGVERYAAALDRRFDRGVVDVEVRERADHARPHGPRQPHPGLGEPLHRLAAS